MAQASGAKSSSDEKREFDTVELVQGIFKILNKHDNNVIAYYIKNSSSSAVGTSGYLDIIKLIQDSIDELSVERTTEILGLQLLKFIIAEYRYKVILDFTRPSSSARKGALVFVPYEDKFEERLQLFRKQTDEKIDEKVLAEAGAWLLQQLHPNAAGLGKQKEKERADAGIKIPQRDEKKRADVDKKVPKQEAKEVNVDLQQIAKDWGQLQKWLTETKERKFDADFDARTFPAASLKIVLELVAHDQDFVRWQSSRKIQDLLQQVKAILHSQSKFLEEDEKYKKLEQEPPMQFMVREVKGVRSELTHGGKVYSELGKKLEKYNHKSDYRYRIAQLIGSLEVAIENFTAKVDQPEILYQRFIVALEEKVQQVANLSAESTMVKQ